MKPKPSACEERQGDLFKVELEAIVDPSHAMVRLAGRVEWARLEQAFGALYSAQTGAPGLPTRLLVALHYLKFTFDLSDEGVVAGWVENPYWQYLSGMKYFEHERPIDPSSMTYWRKRVGEAGAEAMLAETISAGLALGAIKPSQLARVNVDTTVQEKHVRFPTDARLYNRARERLVKAAERRGLGLRQNYRRVGKILFMQSNRYAHARQMRRSRKCQKKLRTILGRVLRDIERQCPEPDEKLQKLMEIAGRIHRQERNDKHKVYSVHEPQVECIAKGKAHKRYEFGAKVSVAATSRGGWLVGALALTGNPYDGHTLAATLAQVERLGRVPEQAFVDQGYRGHDYAGPVQVHVDRKRRGAIARRLWRWMKRRAAVEPAIGHLKQEHRMDRCRLWGPQGDAFNAILGAAGMNFRKLLAHAAVFLRLWPALGDLWLALCQRLARSTGRPAFAGTASNLGLV